MSLLSIPGRKLRLTLNASETPNGTSSPMLYDVRMLRNGYGWTRKVAYLALVAMNQHGVVRPVKDDLHGPRHLTRSDTNLALVGRNVHLKVLDAILSHERAVIGRDCLRNEGTDIGQPCHLVERKEVQTEWFSSPKPSGNHNSPPVGSHCGRCCLFPLCQS
jgi:hypothetical protein